MSLSPLYIAGDFSHPVRLQLKSISANLSEQLSTLCPILLDISHLSFGLEIFLVPHL